LQISKSRNLKKTAANLCGKLKRSFVEIKKSIEIADGSSLAEVNSASRSQILRYNPILNAINLKFCGTKHLFIGYERSLFCKVFM